MLDWFAPLLLVLVANAAPVAAYDIFHDRWAYPVDCGTKVGNKRLLGDSKTFRGLISSILATALVSVGLGFSAWIGACVAAWAMTGDLLSSFTKRRLGMKEGSRATLIDQLPESLFPLLYLHTQMDLSWPRVFLYVATFTLIEMLISPILFRLGLRKRPY